MKNLYFDMDGTIADLYGVEDWEQRLNNRDFTVYLEAKPKVNLQALAHRLNALKKQGYAVHILSWGSKTHKGMMDSWLIEINKIEWLQKHLPSVEIDTITILPYGKKKSRAVCDINGYLFDDNEKVRRDWDRHTNGLAFSETQIFEILEKLK